MYVCWGKKNPQKSELGSDFNQQNQKRRIDGIFILMLTTCGILIEGDEESSAFI